MGRTAVAFALALVCHLGFAGLLVFLSLVHIIVPPPKQAPPPRAVTLRPLSPSQWARNRGERTKREVDGPTLAQRESDAPKLEQKKPEPIPKGQVVDVAPGNGEEAPDAQYLAESANRVAIETRAKEQTAFYRNAMPRRTSTVPQKGGGSDQADRTQIAGNEGLGNDDRPLREQAPSKSVLELPSIKGRQEVKMRMEQATGPGAAVANRSESAEVIGNSDRLRISAGSAQEEQEGSQGKSGRTGVANLMPSSSVLDKITGAAANDHLEEVEGAGTYLNTKEWRYSSFFNRVKQSVGMHWNPGRELRQRDPTGNIYGGRDRHTVLSVTLSDEGMVKDVYVEKSCGLDFLDLEAINSFERAQPFPNPPPGLVAADSTVHFSFGFFLELGGGPRIRLFRSAN